MDTKELRIGNKVEALYDIDNELSEIVTVGCIDNIGVTEHGYSVSFTDGNYDKYNDISGIPLTEEWLLKLGFEKKQHHLIDLVVKVISEVESPQDKSSVIFKEVALSVCNDKGKGEYYFFMKQGNRNDEFDNSIVTITSDMRYVHQLQNLYFSITGKEISY